METYVTLGICLSADESSEEKRKKAMESLGCKEIATYMLMGQFDFMLIFEAPDAQSAAMAVYTAKKATGAENTQTNTLRAFTEADNARFGELFEKMKEV